MKIIGYTDLTGRYKLRKVMKNFEESRLQQQCVAWFRAQYPQYAMLLTHPINEGSRDTRVSGAIHKAEGTVAGVADLLFFLPSVFLVMLEDGKQVMKMYHGLCLELKTEKGKQSQEQKDFQKMIEAAGYKYAIIRSFEDFKEWISDWVRNTPVYTKVQVCDAHAAIQKASEERERKKFLKVIGKK